MYLLQIADAGCIVVLLSCNADRYNHDGCNGFSVCCAVTATVAI
jgi:hypothetical protein